MKPLFRYLLSLLVLLFGLMQPFAHSQNRSIASASSDEDTVVAAKACLDDVQQHPLCVIKSANSGLQKGTTKIDIAEKEVEEEEFSSSRKHSDYSDYTTILFAQTIANIVNDKRRIVPFYQNRSYLSSRRYLVLEVFRI
jgi:hypothetical protein